MAKNIQKLEEEKVKIGAKNMQKIKKQKKHKKIGKNFFKKDKIGAKNKKKQRKVFELSQN